MLQHCPYCKAELTPTPSGEMPAGCPHCGTALDDLPNTDRQGEPMLKAGARLSGFQIIRPLGAGGMGQVYMARQLSLDRIVALKVLPRHYASNYEALKRFLNEVRHTASLEHPNIVSVFEAGEADGFCFLAMIYVDGESLDETLKRENAPFEEARALHIIREIAGALEYAWRKQRLLHRDIKPANIIVDKMGNACLLDLGIAKRLGEANDADLTRRGMAIGTPHYMSPEQARGELDLDCRTDMYSLGATLYHLLTASRPFEATSIVGVLTKQVNDPLPPPRSKNPRLSEGCVRLIEVMMEKNREDRPENWSRVIRDIDRVLRGKMPRAGIPVAAGIEAEGAPSSPLQETQIIPMKRDTAEEKSRLGLGTLAVVALLLAILAGGLIWGIAKLPEKKAALRLPSGQKSGGQKPSISQPAPTPPPPTVSPPETPPKPLVSPQKRALSSQPIGPDEIYSLLKKLVKQGDSPLNFASARRLAGYPDEEKRILWDCLAHYPGKNGEWALAATARLAAEYKATGDWENYEKALRKRLLFIPFAKAEVGIQAYRELVDFLFAHKRDKEANAVLWAGLKANPDGHWKIAGSCARRLLAYNRQISDLGQLKLCLYYCLKHFPPDLPLRSEMQKMMTQLEPPRPSHVGTENPLPKISAEKRKKIEEWQQKAAQEPDPFNRSRYLLKLADLQMKAGLYREAKENLNVVIKRYGRLHKGDIGGFALLKLAKCEQKTDDFNRQILALKRILDENYCGVDDQAGIKAAKLLAAIYKKNKNPALYRQYQELIVKRFGAQHPELAARTLLTLAEGQVEKRRYFLAMELLRRIQQEFPGENGEFARQAKAGIARIARVYPAASRTLSETQGIGKFKTCFRFDGLRDFFEVRERNSTLSQAKKISVSCWIWRPGPASERQYLLSRDGNNQRGFDLYLEDDFLVWCVYDGKKAFRLRAPTTFPIKRWTHIAATAKKGRMRIFINGKRVAEQALTQPENDGAGHLWIARKSWFDPQDQGFFNGWMQAVAVFPDEVFDEDFTPAERPTKGRIKKAFVYLFIDQNGARDLCRNRIITDRPPKKGGSPERLPSTRSPVPGAGEPAPEK